MAKVRRVAHRVQAGQLVTFDEQLWPINVALVVLAGFVAGTVIAVSRFDDPRILYNGWARLASVVATVGLAIWATNKLGSRRIRRGVQLAGVLSLLAHVVLMAILYNQHIAMRPPAEEPELALADEEQELVRLPEYVDRSPDQPQPDFERPVQADAAPTAETDVDREATELERPAETSTPTSLPGTTPRVEPSAMELRQLEQAAPRRAEQSSRLSRQQARVESPAAEQAALPQMARPTEQASQTEANVTPVVRQENQSIARRESPAREPAATAARQTPQVPRRQADPSQPTSPSSLATAERQLRAADVAQQAQAESPQPGATTPSPGQAQPAQPSVSIARAGASPPTAAAGPSGEPAQSAAAQPGAARLERSESPAAPQVATAGGASPARATPTSPAADAQLADSPTSAASQAAEQGAAQPAAAPSSVARAPASAAAGPVGAAGEVPQSASANVAGSAAIARADSPGQPGVPGAASAAAVSRAVRGVGVAASPANVESPALAQSIESDRPEVVPGRAALSKGSAGMVGGGSETNIESGFGARDATSALASGSAPRRAAVQTGPSGTAAVPSAPARIARSLSGANVPAAMFRAEDVDQPTAAGGQSPANVEVSSSAAVRRASATAPRGPIDAGAGRAAVDTGETQVAVGAGSARSAGGGGPVVRVNPQAVGVARAVRGGAPVAAIASPNVAESPSAPAAAGSGGPTADVSTVQPSAASAARRTTVAPAAGGQPTGAQAGTAASSQVAAASLARASGAEGQLAVATPGRTASTGRAARAAVATDTAADAAGLPAETSPSDRASGNPVAAAASGPTRAASSLPGKAGAVDSPVETRIAGSVGAGLNVRKAEGSSGAGPTVADVAAAGPVRKVAASGPPASAAVPIDEPAMEAAPGGGEARPPTAAVAARGEISGPARSSGALPVQVAALPGTGGLGAEIAPQVGSLSRRAQPDSQIVQPSPARFLSPRSGGPAAISGLAREPAEAYSRRAGRRFDKRGGAGVPTERTDRAVELGLDFLARHQSPDGSWSLHKFGAGRPGYENETASIQSDTAATGLALLAFLGGGYDHFDDQFKDQVRGGLEWLIRHQKPNGDLYLPMDSNSNESAAFYSHGIAAIALCEAYGMTGDPDLRQHAQRAIDFIVATQNKTLGAWRYRPQESSDTSVTGWQLMALKSGELAGLNVPKQSYEGVRRWLDAAQASRDDASRYVYNPNATSDAEHDRTQGRVPTPTMSGVGLLMRLYLGWNRDDPRMAKGADHLLDNLPAIGTRDRRLRDTYYWYYATLVMFHMKGKHWQMWNDRLEPLLVERQVQQGALAGSWDPRGSVPDKWAAHGGRIYVTTMNLLSLEVYYRHLPIYESTAR